MVTLPTKELTFISTCFPFGLVDAFCKRSVLQEPKINQQENCASDPIVSVGIKLTQCTGS